MNHYTASTDNAEREEVVRPNIFPTEVALSIRGGGAPAAARSQGFSLANLFRAVLRLPSRIVRRCDAGTLRSNAKHNNAVERTVPMTSEFASGWLRERHAPGAGFEKLEGDATHNRDSRLLKVTTGLEDFYRKYQTEKFSPLHEALLLQVRTEKGETSMDRLNAVLVLKEMLMQLESELGLDELPDVERTIIVAAHSLSATPGSVLEADQLRNHWLIAPLAHATYYRALKNLMSLGFMQTAEGSRAKLYVLQHERLSK